MNHIDDQTIKILKKYFVFDQIFDLNQYDRNNMSQLHSDLSKLKKETYTPEYRFIFLHYETEYYLDKRYPGLTLWNLQSVLSNLDISNYFCLILSQQDISDKLKFLQKQETTDQTAIASIKYQNYYWTNEYLLPKVDHSVKIHSETISKKYLCLNRNLRFHRRVLFSLLNHNNLLDDGIVSYLGMGEARPDVLAPSLSETNIKKNLCLLEVSTSTRVNDRWLLRDENIKKHVRNIPDGYVFKNFKESQDSNSFIKFLDLSLEQQCFLHVISETVYNYPSSFTTEKTMKPILYKRPFVVVGPPGSVANLKSLGFKTFDRWWDESYDQIEDNEQRLLAVVDIIKQTCQKNILDLRDICNEMESVLEYNFDFYVTHFKQQQIDILHKFCKENLEPRYD